MQVKQIILFRPKSWANITKHLNFRISGQQIERINQVKYLSLVVNEFFEWRTHFIHLKKNLNQAISLLSKIGHNLSQNLLKSIYFLLFNPHVIYGYQIWGQEHSNKFKKYENFKRKQ